MEEKKYPKSIEPCPILEATVELRCKFLIPGDAIVGVIYNEFRNEFALSGLPVNQIPIEVRRVDPNLRHKPTHRLLNSENKNLIIDVGADVIMFTYVLKYEGWNTFKPFIEKYLTKIINLNIIAEISYLSLRYLDFFQNNIFNNIILRTTLNNELIGSTPTVIRTEIHEDDIAYVLQIANNTHVENQTFKADGSIIDITSVLRLRPINISNIIDFIERLHSGQKRTFFSLFTPEFLQTLNPKY